MQTTIIGHSTLVIDIAGKKIITDPYFGLRGHIAYRRLAPPAQPRQALTEVDLVLVSHNHWDHIDRPYFHMLSSDMPVMAPNRVKWATSLRGAKNVVGIQPWESHQFGTVEVTGVPATHLTVTVGFVIQGEGRKEGESWTLLSLPMGSLARDTDGAPTKIGHLSSPNIVRLADAPASRMWYTMTLRSARGKQKGAN